MAGVVLLTGFGPFNGYHYNTSGFLAEELDGVVVKGYRVVGLVLPVALRRAFSVLDRAVEEYKPVLILGLGLAPRAREVVLELAAAGVVDYERDEDGEGYRFHRIGGRLVLATRLPAERVYRVCRMQRMLPLRVGLSAGSFLCNAVAYRIHEHAERLGVPGGFLHVPPDTVTAMRLGLPGGVPMWLLRETVLCVVRACLG